MTTVTLFGRRLAVRFVLGMTSGTTTELLLMGRSLGNEITGLCSMTCGTEIDRDIDVLLQSDVLRLMRQVTEHTITLHHRFPMPSVTVETDPDPFVFTVTGGTVLLAVATRHLSELLLDLRMTTDTYWS